MPVFPSYAVGTVAIPVGSTVATFVGALLNSSNARGGDTLIVNGHEVGIYECPTTLTATIDAWPAAYGAVVAGTTYKIRQDSPLRFAGAQTWLDVSNFIASLNADPLFIDTSSSGRRVTLRDWQHDTLALAVAAFITAPQMLVVLGGYAAAGDGGYAVYKRVLAAPSHPGKFTDASGGFWEIVPINGMVNVRQLGAKGDGVTNDYNAIINTKAVASALSVAMVFDYGTFITTISIDFAWRNASNNTTKVLALTPDVTLKFTGSGAGFFINGGLIGGTLGIGNVIFGGAHQISLKGTNACTDLFTWNSINFAYIKAIGRDCTGVVFKGDDQVGGVSSPNGSSVESTFELTVSAVVDNLPFAPIIPTEGLHLTQAYTSHFHRTIIESCGVASLNTGVALYTCAGNRFNGGTFEGNVFGGIYINPTSRENEFNSIICEANGNPLLVTDWSVLGHNNIFNNCSGSMSFTTGATRNQISGGTSTAISFSAGANDNVVDGCEITALTIAIGATSNLIANCTVLATSVDNELTTLMRNNSGILTDGWKSYVPAVTATTPAGSGFSITSISGKFKLTDRKTCVIHYQFTITNIGSGPVASGLAKISVPTGIFAILTGPTIRNGTCYESVFTGNMGVSRIRPGVSQTIIEAHLSGGPAIFTNGYVIQGEIEFELA